MNKLAATTAAVSTKAVRAARSMEGNQMNDATFTMNITKEISYAELWSAVWGSETTSWFTSVRKPDGKGIDLWTKPDFEPNPQDFRLYDAEQDEWHLVTLADLARGYQLAYEQQTTHCGNCLVADLDDPDACSGDYILQLAIFGELIYG